jgi:3-phosphoshikimate 1-carboxyvinyltransferase
MMAMSSLFPAGNLTLDAHPSLRARPHGEILAFTGVDAPTWPLTLPCGRPLPDRISLERSSQFATALLIAGAAQVFRGQRSEYRLEILGERRSEPYLRMTMKMLASTGLELREEKGIITLRPGKIVPKKLRFRIERDASSLAFLEAYARRWRLRSFFPESESLQGDAVFPRLLDQLEQEEELSLRETPDLAPPLWAAAALQRRLLRVKDFPQLRLKESDRIRLLVEAARKLGAEAEEADDGFRVDFRRLRVPREPLFLRTDGDHRMAMAFGLLSTEGWAVEPDRRDCVRKSFPSFWAALQLLEEALPG